jgi:predicted permease
MSFWRRLRDRISGHADRDLDRELRAHLELETEEQQGRGVRADEARYAALRVFGNTVRVKEEVRKMWGWTKLEQVVQDVQYSIRGARKNPGFAFVAILSLALGIGATTAVFSVLNAAVLRPLPVTEPDRLVILQPELRGKRFVLFNPIFEELRRSQHSLTGMFAISNEPYLKAAFDSAPPVFVRGSLVSGNYFQELGVSPALGRLVTPGNDEPSAETCAAVLSHAFWIATMHADPGVLGRRMIVREKVCTIVGVVPAEFRGHEPGYTPDLWIPLRPLTDPKLLSSRSMAFFSGVMGRLRPDVTIAQAEAELTALYQRIQAADPRPSPRPGETPPEPSDFRIAALPGAQGLDTVRRNFGQPLALALAVTGMVLLIASVNVASLLLARGAARTREFATRAALGAGRGRLMRSLVIEGAVLAAAGAVVGVAIAFLVTPALSKVVSVSYMPVALVATPDARVLGVALAATAFATILAGVLPAIRLSGRDLQIGMAGAARITGTRAGQRLNRTLVAAQLALVLLLVTAAGLMLRTMLRILSVDPGFNASRVVLMDVRDTEPAARFGDADSPEQKARRAAQYQALDQRLNAIPGVESASLSWLGLFGGSYVGLDTYDAEHPDDRRFTLLDYVTPRYFETVGMQVVRGRSFTDADREGAMPVALVNEAFVRERIGGREPVGQRFVWTYQDEGRRCTIVGVLRDAKYNDLRESRVEPMMWLPLGQAPFKITSLALRVQPGAEEAAVRAARAALEEISPHVMVRKTTTLRAQVHQATARERLLLKLTSGFGGIALLLAVIGLYGTAGYAVVRRTPEIGIRLALGAQRSDVLRSVLRESLLLVAAGMAAGVPLCVAAGNVLRGFLFGVTPYDWPTIVGAGVVLTAAALAAALGPARRASRVDPISALRYE